MAQQASKKVRVFELAKTLGLESKQLIDYCKDLGYDVKNQLSSLEPDQVDSLKVRISKGGKPPAPTTAAQAPRPTPSGPKVERKINSLPPPRPRADAPSPLPVPPDVSAPVEMPAPVELEPEPDFPEPIATPEPAPIAVEPETAAPPKPVEPAPARVPVLAPARPQVIAPPKAIERPIEPVAPDELTHPVVVEATAPPAPPISVAEPEPVSTPEIPTPAVESVEESPAPRPAVPVAPKPTPVLRPPTLHRPRPTNLNPPRPTSTPGGPGGSSASGGPGAASGPARPATPATGRPPSSLPAGSPPAARGPGGPGMHGGPSGPGGRPGSAGPGGPGGARPGPGGGGHGHAPAGARQGPGGARPGSGMGGPGGPRTGGPGSAGGPGGPRTGGPGGGPGAATGDRHRRPLSERRPGAPGAPGRPSGPGGPGGPRADAGSGPGGGPGGAGGARRFTLDELKKLREGRGVNEVRREMELPATPRPAPGTTDEPEDEEGRNKKAGAKPGTGTGDRRAAERARRTEQRKVKTKDIVIEGGHVDVIEDHLGSRRGPRAALLKKQKRLRQPGTVDRKGKVPINLPITVRSLSEAIGMKAAELLFKLKDLTNSLFTINSTVEVAVAELIAGEKGIEFDIQKPKDAEEDLFEEHKEAAEDESKLESRAPVVTIMGHVDHGKTTLLDTIRKRYGLESDVVSTEAGGITQVIRAWRVEKDGKPITFLDTPGHEAFTKMRARGANVTDVVVIVVAADSGVQPQTEEAVSHAKAADVSIVVAINKIDMPGADPTRVERQLYQLGLLPDSMGGDCQFVRVSAVKGTGVDELLETLALVAEIQELTANPHKPAQGTCLEANLSGDEGVIATILVQQGTLHRGDVLVCGSAFGRVRAMYDDLGRPINEAGPSVPVRISGLDAVPNADDHFHVVTELSKAREIAEKRKIRIQEASQTKFSPVTLDKLGAAKSKIVELKVILKAEARGSVEAIRKELEKLVHDEVRVRVLHAAIGAITESDVQLALASPEDSMIVGFNVVPDDTAIRLAESRGVPIREYNIIYKLTEDIKSALEGKLKPEERVIHLGRAVIRELFKISRVGTVAGCYVTQGNIERSAKIRVIREGAVIFPPPERTAALDSLKRFKDDVREVKEGYDCGMKVAGYDDLKVGDVIEAYRIEQVQRTL